jgi:CheY-like chemotaxis protein
MQRRGLVVGDEPRVCEMIGKVLHSAGLEALTITRSAQAPEILEEGKFDVLLLNLHMPSPDGIELPARCAAPRAIARRPSS